LDEIVLPKLLKESSDSFLKYYKSIIEGNNNKIIKISHTFSLVEIQTNLFKLTNGKNLCKDPITLILNNVQASLLILFNKNKNDSLSLYKISKELSIPVEILKENILPLINNPQNNILKKINKNLDFKLNVDNESLSIEDDLCLNDNFSTQEKILKFYEKNQKENFIKKEIFEGERSYVIEANIVKILKMNKRMNIHELMEKVMKSIEIFKISISVILIL
jgi:hypothetical protein